MIGRVILGGVDRWIPGPIDLVKDTHAIHNLGGYVDKGGRRRTQTILRTPCKTKHTKKVCRELHGWPTFGKSDAPLQSVKAFIADIPVFPERTTIAAGKGS